MFPPAGVGIFSTLFIIVFIIVVGTILVRAIGGVARWKSNNKQPVLTVPASVVTKRTEVHRHTNALNNNNGMNGQVMTSNSTSYFVTFQFESGDRLELKVHGSDFGLLADGDNGKLTFQVTRFLEFSRT